MKLAHVLDTPFASHGGLPMCARLIATGLSSEYKTYVFCPIQSDQSITSDFKSDNINLVEWNPNEHGFDLNKFIRQKFEEIGIQVALFHGGDFSWGVMGGKLSLINALKMRGLSIIAINHQSNPIFSRMPMGEPMSLVACTKSFLRFGVAWFYKNIQLAATDAEINVSRYEYRMSRLRYPFFTNKFKLVYNSRLPPLIGAEIPKKDKEKTILSVGHFAYRKGQHVLLRAFGRIAADFPSWRLRLVGASGVGDYHSHLEFILDDLNLRDRVDFVTETYDPDEYFRRASVYVQPSLVEAYGLALQEAMYFGCACVGSEAGGITDSVTDPEYLFPPGDDAALAGILSKLLSNEDLLADRMNKDQTEARRLKRDRESMLDAYRELINLLGSRKSQSA